MSGLGHEYRLREVTNYQSALQKDITRRKELIRRYKRGYNTTYYINLASTSVTGILAASSIATAVSIIGMPVSAALAGVTTLLAGTSASSLVINKRMSEKLSKHEAILLLAVNTLESLKSLTSTAVDNDKISDEEFESITKCFTDVFFLL